MEESLETILSSLAVLGITAMLVYFPSCRKEMICYQLYNKKASELRLDLNGDGMVSHNERMFFSPKLHKDDEWSSSGCSIPYSEVKAGLDGVFHP